MDTRQSFFDSVDQTIAEHVKHAGMVRKGLLTAVSLKANEDLVGKPLSNGFLVEQVEITGHSVRVWFHDDQGKRGSLYVSADWGTLIFEESRMNSLAAEYARLATRVIASTC